LGLTSIALLVALENQCLRRIGVVDDTPPTDPTVTHSNQAGRQAALQVRADAAAEDVEGATSYDVMTDAALVGDVMAWRSQPLTIQISFSTRRDIGTRAVLPPTARCCRSTRDVDP
jgi:hypothetical protein